MSGNVNHLWVLEERRWVCTLIYVAVFFAGVGVKTRLEVHILQYNTVSGAMRYLIITSTFFSLGTVVIMKPDRRRSSALHPQS